MGNNGLKEAVVTASGPQLTRSTHSDLVLDLYAKPCEGPTPSLGKSQQDLGGAKADPSPPGSPHEDAQGQQSGHVFLHKTVIGYTHSCPSKTYPCFPTSSPPLHLCSKPIITG